MNKLKLLLIPTIFLFLIVGAFAQSNELPFFDNFNRYASTGVAVGGNWTATPALGWASRDADATRCVDDAVDDCIESAGVTASPEYVLHNVSTRGFKNITLKYMERCIGSISSEYLATQVSSDGTSFTTLRNISSATTPACDGVKRDIKLNLTSIYWDNANFKVRYVCGARSMVTEPCNIDNVSISGIEFCKLPKNMNITTNTTFCSGTFINTISTNGVKVLAPNVVLSCINTTLDNTVVEMISLRNKSQILFNCNIKHGSEGVVVRAENVSIIHNTFSLGDTGAVTTISKGTVFFNNTFLRSVDGVGINIASGKGNHLIVANKFINFNTSSSITVSSTTSPANVIISNRFTNITVGFLSAFSIIHINSENNTILNNRFTNVGDNGFSEIFIRRNFNFISNNTFINTPNAVGGIGIETYGCPACSPSGTGSFNIISKNTFINTPGTAFFLAGSRNILMNNTVINITNSDGRFVSSTGNPFFNQDFNIIRNNKFIGKFPDYGIEWNRGSNNTFINNIFNRTSGGSPGTAISILGSGRDNTISGNTFAGNFNQIILDNEHHNILTMISKGNVINWSTKGDVSLSQNNFFLGNNIFGLNSSLQTNLNRQAKITLVNLTAFNFQPAIFQNAKFVKTTGAVLANKTLCNPPKCTNLTWNNVTKILTFFVSSWSSFATNSTSPPTNYNIFIKDEDTKATILGNGQMFDITPTQTREFTTNIGRFGVPSFTFEKHQLDISATGPTSYPQRSFFVTINTSTGNFTFFLLNQSQGQNVKFNVRDEGGSPVEDADLIFTRFLTPPGGYVTVQQENTQLLGFVNAFLNPLISYRIHISASGFATRTFDLQPTETEYTIIIRRTATINFFNFLKDIVYAIIPDAGPLQTKSQQNFTLITTAPNGTIDYFAVRSNFSSIVYLNNISISPAGGTAMITVNTTGKAGQTIGVDYYIKRIGNNNVLKVHKNYLLLGSITPSNTSVTGIANIYKNEIGNIWTGIIAIFASVILGLTFLPFAGSIGAGIISLLAFICFGLVGWISMPIVIASAVIVVGTYLLTGGRE